MNREQLQDALHEPYDRERWREVLSSVFGAARIEFERFPPTIPLNSEKITSFSRIGSVRLEDGAALGVFEVQVDERTKLARNRVELRNAVMSQIDQAVNNGVLVVFNSTGDDYRFTFAARETAIAEDGQLVQTETAPKRYTYVLGPNETCRTAADRFHDLSLKRDAASLDDVQDAFSVEKLNKEFFNAYKEHYARFTDYLINSDYRHSVFGVGEIKDSKARAAAEKPIRDFAKRLLGRIVFLHFIQKKGWLGCPADRNDWVGGNLQFLRDLFDAADDPDRFHSTCLLPLFHGALNTPDRPNDIFELTQTRIPYLNGGLFERDDPDVSGIDFPAAYFRELLDFFAQYNFTIDENDPEEHEVGIDPEMLGHIFENLLEDNKDKGAYYTPKAIVQYMCQESLIQYLQTHLGEHKELQDLVRLKSRGDEHNKDNFIIRNAPEIERLLDAVKVCDPAIGSGAFPIGILQEIYWIKLTLDLTLDRAELKRGIIQNSIYGVDIDAGAVEIARLRFWLSLVVDEESPSPLPNLDYKIMQGNSLLESFEGIPLANLTEGEQVSVRVFGSNQDELNLGAVGDEFRVQVDEERRQSIIALMDRYFSEADPREKARIHSEIDRFVLDHIDHNIALHKDRLEIELHQLHASIKEKQKKAKKYKPTKKEERRLKQLQDEIAADDGRKQRLHELEHKPERPFFLWHLYFQNVLDDGGFDILIANPPYVRMELFKDLKPELRRYYEHVHAERADLYCYFYALAVARLKDRGVLCFISSNKFFRAGYGAKLRTHLVEDTELSRVFDFGDLPIFDATTYPCIVLTLKGRPAAGHEIHTTKVDRQADIPRFMLLPHVDQPQTGFSWRLESPEVLHLLEKMRQKGTPLKDHVGSGIYMGVKTGLNEAFIIDGETKDQLVTACAEAARILKPYLGGKHARRWVCDYPDLWMLYLPHGVDTSGLDPVLALLKPLKDRLEARATKQEWYELQQPQEKFVEIYVSSKIVFPDIANSMRFSLDTRGAFFSNTAYCIASDDLFLLAVLNASATQFFYQHLSAQFRGGYLRFWTQYVEQIPIPEAIDSERQELATLAGRAGQAAGSDLAAIETEIDQKVNGLFGFTPAEVSLIEEQVEGTKASTDTKSDLRAVLLPSLKQLFPYFTIDDVRALLESKQIEIADSTLKRYMSDFMEQGVIHDAGRGWYSSIKKPFVLNTEPVEEVIARIEKQFPLLDFSCWSTEQINPYMQHLLAKFVTFVHVDEDAVRSVGEWLQDEGFNTYVNPGKGEIEKSFAVRENTVVVRPGNVEEAEGGRHVVPIEFLLVDLLHEVEKLPLMAKGEAKAVAERAILSARILMGQFLMFAKRRRIDLSWLKTTH